MSKQLLAQSGKSGIHSIVDIDCGSMHAAPGCGEVHDLKDGSCKALADEGAGTLDSGNVLVSIFGSTVRSISSSKCTDKASMANRMRGSSMLFLKISLTRQKELRTTAYNKFTLDLVKNSINLFSTHIQREQNYVMIKAEYTSIDSVLKILKATVRRDVRICTNIPVMSLPAIRVGKDELVINGSTKEISGLRKEEARSRTPDTKDLSATETLLTFEYLKFSMMEILQKEALEQILDRNGCEMAYTSHSSQYDPPSQFVVKIYSTRCENTRECKRELNDLYHSSILLTWRDTERAPKSLYIENGIFIREDGGRCMAFGSIEDVQRIVKTSTSAYESYFLVDSEMGDFICGKKFGKTMKISRSTDCILDVEVIKTPHSEASKTADDRSEADFCVDEKVLYRFKIRGSGSETVNCYKFLLDEFPVELCFDLDRKHHKKIIGMKGMTIQKIMKKYNIYAKFMSTKEARENGFSGNVILKTPRKNADNLEKSKDEILAMSEEEASSPKALCDESECKVALIEEMETERYPSIESLLKMKKDVM